MTSKAESQKVTRSQILEQPVADNLQRLLHIERLERGDAAILLKGQNEREVGVLLDLDSYNLLRALSEEFLSLDTNVLPREESEAADGIVTREKVFER